MNNSRENILRVTKASFRVFDVPHRYRIMILKAFTAYDWDFYYNSDGLTLFNVEWVNEFHPVFVWHDYAMQNREYLRGDKDEKAYIRDTNLTLKKLMEIYHFGRIRTWLYPILATLAFKLFKR